MVRNARSCSLHIPPVCITKNGKILRITLKFAVYLDRYYKDPKHPRNRCRMMGPTDLEADQALHQNLFVYTLQDLAKNIVEKPIKIQKLDFLANMLMVGGDTSSGMSRSHTLQRHLANLITDSIPMPYFDEFDYGGFEPAPIIEVPLHQEILTVVPHCCA